MERPPPKERPVTIGICTSALRSNIEAFIVRVSSLTNVTARFIQLPYNDLDSFQLSRKGLDGVIICHSINNRRFAITNVMDALYDVFLPHVKQVFGKNNVCVIAHDFPWPTGSAREDHFRIKGTYMDSFRSKQPTTFECSNLTMICGRFDTQVDIDEEDWIQLGNFVRQCQVRERHGHMKILAVFAGLVIICVVIWYAGYPLIALLRYSTGVTITMLNALLRYPTGITITMLYALKRYLTGIPITMLDAPKRYLTGIPITMLDAPKRYLTGIPITMLDAPKRYLTGIPITMLDAPKRYLTGIPITMLNALLRYPTGVTITMLNAVKRYLTGIPITMLNAVKRYLTGIPIAMLYGLKRYLTGIPIPRYPTGIPITMLNTLYRCPMSIFATLNVVQHTTSWLSWFAMVIPHYGRVIAYYSTMIPNFWITYFFRLAYQ